MGPSHVSLTTSQVSLFCARIISASETLKYIVWLGIHAKLDGDDSMPLSCKAEALLAHERNWLALKAPREDHLTPQRKASQLYPSGLGGSYFLIDTQEENIIRRGRLPSTLSNKDNWIDGPIHITRNKLGLSIMDASRGLLIVP